MNDKNNITTIGLVGLGLMGQGIASCLVKHGFNLIAFDKLKEREQDTITHITYSFEKLKKRNLVSDFELVGWENRFKYVGSLKEMGDCQFIIETVGESLELKGKIYKELESAIGKDVVIATNTSGISISLLQNEISNKERFIGMHWAEPAEITKYLEISRAKDTSDAAIEVGVAIGKRCGKHPTVLNFDVPGLISNRLFYAMAREAMHIVESGVADIETVDRSFRNDIGWWSTICGPFRWMDITGLPIYAKVMEGLFPELSKNDNVPELIKEKVTSNSKFYKYTSKEEKVWEETWTDFSHDIAELVKKYEKKVNL